MMWAIRLLPWTRKLESSLLLFSSHFLPSWPKGYNNLELMTSLLDHTTGIQNPGISFPNAPEPSSRACTGLFSGSGPRADRTDRLPTPSLWVAMSSIRERWRKGNRACMCKARVSTHAMWHKALTLQDKACSEKRGGLGIAGVWFQVVQEFLIWPWMNFPSWKYFHPYRRRTYFV